MNDETAVTLQKIKEDIKSTQSKDYSRSNPYARGWNLAMDHACAVIDAVLQKQDKLAVMKQMRQNIDMALSMRPILVGTEVAIWDSTKNNVLQSIDDLIARHGKGFMMMHHSGRIPHILDEVQALWIKYPDLRFLQLMEIMMDRAETATGKDSFMIEDDELLNIGLESLWAEVTA